ncbi:MAG: hypothetical protein R2809_11125 [Flavobacteriales bacterium]
MKYSLFFLLIVLAAACSSGPASKDISSGDSTNLEADTSIDNYKDEETLILILQHILWSLPTQVSIITP